MTQRLINIAINFEEEDEESVAAAIAAKFGGTASTVKDAVDVIAANLELIDGAHVPHWSCPEQGDWMTQQEELGRLWAIIDQHQYDCCHQTSEPPVGATDFVRGECPPAHNCKVCAATIV
jgi:hypothetical protein